VPALTDVCISIVARHVEDVESLGDIGQENMRRVNNIICKNRKMCVPASFWSCDGSC
jgi:DNA repair protein RAD7